MGGTSFLFLDGFSGHLMNIIEENCLFYGIQLLIITTHTSDQVKLLDLGICAIHEMESRLVCLHLCLNNQTSKLIKMFCGSQRTPTGTTAISVFRKAGITS
jgi:hypothetical protein